MTSSNFSHQISEIDPNLYTLNPDFHDNKEKSKQVADANILKERNISPNINVQQKKVVKNKKFGYEIQLDSLQREIIRLKNHIDVKLSQNTKEIDELKISYELKMKSIEEKRCKEIEAINEKLLLKESELDQNRSKLKEEKDEAEEIASELKRVNTENGLLTNKAQNELAKIKYQHEVLTNKEIPDLAVDTNRTKEIYAKELDSLIQINNAEFQNIKKDIELKKANVLELISDLNKWKNEKQSIRKGYKENIQKLRTKINQNIQKIRENDIEIKNYSNNIETFKSNGELFSQEITKLEAILSSEMKIKPRLAKKFSKLDKIVNGKKSPCRHRK